MSVESCPLCAEMPSRCPLCLAQPDLAYDEAKRVEGRRLALVFAERGVLPELRDVDPDRTLPEAWTGGGRR